MIERERMEWELADRVICGSQFVITTMAEEGGPVDKCRLVPYPIPSLVHEPPHQIPYDQDKRIRLLFVGTLQLRKGIQYLWQAAGQLDTSKFHIRAIGPSCLSSFGETAVRDRIEWLGRIRRSEMAAQYRWADCFVLPTLSEGSANVCWEAIAAGVPVITTDAAGIEPISSSIEVIATQDIGQLTLSLRKTERRDKLIPIKDIEEPDPYGSYGRRLIAAIQN